MDYELTLTGLVTEREYIDESIIIVNARLVCCSFTNCRVRIGKNNQILLCDFNGCDIDHITDDDIELA
jgi:hypothetical protein